MHRQLTLIALIVLAGCSKSGEQASTAEGAKDAKPVAAPAANALGAQLKPGEWEMTTRVAEMNVPGMARGALPQQLAEGTTLRTCIEKQPDASFFAGRKNSDCTYQDFSMASGRIRGKATCNTRSGKMAMTMDGEYHPENYDMNMSMKSDQMSMTMHTEGHRVGECTVSAEKAKKL